MMKLNYSKKILILSVVSLVAIVIVDFLFLNLLADKIIGINDKIRQQTLSTQEREKNFYLKESISKTEIDRAKIEKYFIGPGDVATAEFIAYLENLAKQNKLTATVRSVGYEIIPEVGNSDVVSALRFRFSVTGKWSDVFVFLQIMENIPKAVSVFSVTLNSASGAWTADLDFSVAKLKN